CSQCSPSRPAGGGCSRCSRSSSQSASRSAAATACRASSTSSSSSRASARGRSRMRARRGRRTPSGSPCSPRHPPPTPPTSPASGSPSACSSQCSRCSPRRRASAPAARRTSSPASCGAGRSSRARFPGPSGDLGMTWQFALGGLLIGILVGMTGMGGGSLMTPMLILLFGFDPKTAVGTDILHGAIFKSFGAFHHRRLGNVHVPLSLWMLVGSAPLSLVGVQLASSFSDSTQSAMGRVVGGALIAGGIGFLVKSLIRGRASDAPLHLSTRDKTIAVAIGATCGFVVGLTSVGSGTFFGLAMLLVYPLTAQRIVGTDLLHAALLLWVAGAGHLVQGNVDLHAMAWLLVGSIPGVFVGSRLSIRVPERALRVAFSFV